jgi:glycosyltransferase involved in cell wall biosynthesis
MINIYLYVRHFPPEADRHHDGIVKAVHGLATGLVAAGTTLEVSAKQRVTVLSEGSATQRTSVQTTAGYTLECFANPIQSRPSFRLSPALKAYIRSIPPHSIVILNGIFHASIYAMSRLCRKHNVPYIIAPHDVYSPPMFARSPHLKWPYWWLLEKRMLQQAKAVQVLEVRQGEWLRRLGINTTLLTVSNGTIVGSGLANLGVQQHENSVPKLFFFGRMDRHHKGLDLLLKAFSIIVKQTPVELTIQGPNEGDRPMLERQAQELAIPVTFLDPEYQRSPVSIISQYDIFCLPSRFEGFGLSALEAMMAERVLLVSEVAGIAPHIEASGCGIVVAPTVTAIVQGLVTLLERRSEWQKMGLQGREYAIQQLDWNRIGAIALRQYLELMPQQTSKYSCSASASLKMP